MIESDLLETDLGWGEPKNFQALFFNGEMRKKLKTYSNTRTALSTYVPQPDSGTVGVK